MRVWQVGGSEDPEAHAAPLCGCWAPRPAAPGRHCAPPPWPRLICASANFALIRGLADPTSLSVDLARGFR